MLFHIIQDDEDDADDFEPEDNEESVELCSWCLEPCILSFQTVRSSRKFRPFSDFRNWPEVFAPYSKYVKEEEEAK